MSLALAHTEGLIRVVYTQWGGAPVLHVLIAERGQIPPHSANDSRIEGRRCRFSYFASYLACSGARVRGDLRLCSRVWAGGDPRCWSG